MYWNKCIKFLQKYKCHEIISATAQKKAVKTQQCIINCTQLSQNQRTSSGPLKLSHRNISKIQQSRQTVRSRTVVAWQNQCHPRLGSYSTTHSWQTTDEPFKYTIQHNCVDILPPSTGQKCTRKNIDGAQQLCAKDLLKSTTRLSLQRRPKLVFAALQAECANQMATMPISPAAIAVRVLDVKDNSMDESIQNFSIYTSQGSWLQGSANRL